MKRTEYLFHLSSCRAWPLPEMLHSLYAAFETHSISVVKLDSKDPPLLSIHEPKDIDEIFQNWKEIESSKWIFGKTNIKSMSTFALTAYRHELILNKRGLNRFYVSAKCHNPEEMFNLCSSLCAALDATHAYFDSIDRINSRLHRVRDDGSVEKNPISIFHAIPGLFRWNFFASGYRKHLQFDQCGPAVNIRNISEGVILTSLNTGTIDYNQAELDAISVLGPRYFHRSGKPDYDCLAPSIHELAS